MQMAPIAFSLAGEAFTQLLCSGGLVERRYTPDHGAMMTRCLMSCVCLCSCGSDGGCHKVRTATYPM